MSDGNDEVDMTRTLSSHLLLCHLNTATVAHDALIAYALVLTAGTLIVFLRTEDALAEKSVTLGLVCTIVDGLWFSHLAERALEDLLRRSQTNGNFGEITLYL